MGKLSQCHCSVFENWWRQCHFIDIQCSAENCGPYSSAS